MEGDGFEPPNPKERIYSPPRLATSLPLQNGAGERSRTHNLLIRSQTLYPIELRALIFNMNNTVIIYSWVFKSYTYARFTTSAYRK